MSDRGGLNEVSAVAAPDRHQANPARVYDYLLGGKNNYAADRRAGEELKKAKPDLVPNVLASRAFLVRAVRHLTGAAGIGQFLDIGTGLPASNPTHEVAQQAAPTAKVVYVDNDPAVLVHAQALLTSTGAGSCTFVEADLRDPEHILRLARDTLDFSRPVAVMLLGILYLITDEEDPYGIVRQLMAATAPGSYLLILHPASDIHADQAARAAGRYARRTGIAQTNRSHADVARFFDGLELMEPGVVQANRWRPIRDEDARPELSNWAGVGRKP
jgi:O-methyltransferase involved in polyketide biosynthesis